jgi:hypothetical protein
MSKNAVTTETRLMVRMGAAGYTVGAPTAEAQDQDCAIARNTPCPHCWGPMRFLPFVRRDDKSYRAFAYCADCDHAEEF